MKFPSSSQIVSLIFVCSLLPVIHFLFNPREIKLPEQKKSVEVVLSATTPVTPLIPLGNSYHLKNDTLVNYVQNALSGASGVYAVGVKSLKTGETYYFNEHIVYESASLYKLWIMAVMYQQIQSGTLKKEEILSAEIPELNRIFNILPELAEKSEGTITLSVSNALTKMITVSDNYSAMLLGSRVGLPNVSRFLINNGFNESSIGSSKGNATSTAFDMVRFFKMLYKGELANAVYTKEMINLLRGQKLNGKLPKDLPKDVVIAHKTGELDAVTHDAGIVYAPNGAYVIVVLTSSEKPAQAVGRISAVSEAVFEYFSQ